MSVSPDRRRVARLRVPPHFGKGAIGDHDVQVLNVSPLGARVAHWDRLHDGALCHVDLLPPLGPVRLTGRVAWSELPNSEQSVTGEQLAQHESGIEFAGPTHEQLAVLAAVMATLRATEYARDHRSWR